MVPMLWLALLDSKNSFFMSSSWWSTERQCQREREGKRRGEREGEGLMISEERDMRARARTCVCACQVPRTRTHAPTHEGFTGGAAGKSAVHAAPTRVGNARYSHSVIPHRFCTNGRPRTGTNTAHTSSSPSPAMLEFRKLFYLLYPSVQKLKICSGGQMFNI